MDDNSTKLAAILADSNELQTDWADGGRLDLLIDSILEDTNELQGDDVPGLITALPTQSEITGGAYPLDTDANGRMRIVDGTGAGELDLASGLIAGIAGTKNTLDDLNDIAGCRSTNYSDDSELRCKRGSSYSCPSFIRYPSKHDGL